MASAWRWSSCPRPRDPILPHAPSADPCTTSPQHALAPGCKAFPWLVHVGILMTPLLVHQVIRREGPVRCELRMLAFRLRPFWKARGSLSLLLAIAIRLNAR